MKLYLAAPFEELERLRIVRARVLLETPQHEVVSSWLKEPPSRAVIEEDFYWPVLALRDLAEIRVCNVLILDTFTHNARGGSQTEYGFAMALGKQVWVVGPIRNVFNSIAQRKFKNWDQVLDILKTYQ